MSSVDFADPAENMSVIRPNLKMLQQRAPRLRGADVPWISTVRLPWGLEVCLLNISSTGILVETSSKFSPGSFTELRLVGSDSTLAVPARFLRSEIVSVDGRGVRYQAAAAFEKELDLVQRGENRPDACSMSARLADWLHDLSIALKSGADADILLERIDRGVHGLARVQDVRIAAAPTPPRDGCESVCFTVGKGSGPTVLQATFEAGQVPSDLDFKLLQAGAALAAVVLALRRDSADV